MPDLRLQLTLPVTRVRVGALEVDTVTHFLGAPLDHFLGALQQGPAMEVAGPDGRVVEQRTLALRPGEGLHIPLAKHGELGLHNADGHLVLTLPADVGDVVEQLWSSHLLRGPIVGPSMDGQTQVRGYLVQVRSGLAARWPLGLLGEAGIEIL